jgi:hypothetical protein
MCVYRGLLGSYDQKPLIRSNLANNGMVWNKYIRYYWAFTQNNSGQFGVVSDMGKVAGIPILDNNVEPLRAPDEGIHSSRTKNYTNYTSPGEIADSPFKQIKMT